MGRFARSSLSREERRSSGKGTSGVVSAIGKYVPLLRWLPNYSRLQALSDLVAGITLGLTMIPQSIAYAALAGLTAQYGLYSSFLGAFTYVLFGTIKEVSIGPTSLMALLTLEYTRDMPVDFIVLLCFLSGCVELVMGVLNLGFVVDFISIPVTSGFTSATSVIIIVSQLQGLLGLKYKSANIVDNLAKMLRNLGSVRGSDLALGLASIAFLLIFRKLKDLECPSSLRRALWFASICRNAIVVLITSVIAFRLETTGSPTFTLSGKVESGLPTVSLPPFSSHVGNRTYTFLDMCSHYGSGVVVVPVIAVLANVAIAKAFASGATVDASQEMLTLGLCNIFGSFVSSMPSCGAFTRSAVSSASGVQTPMAGLYSGVMTLLALSFLTPYFYYIPRSTLAAVLISAVIFMIDWRIIGLLWRGCRRDALAAVTTFAVCVIFSVEIGLLVGAILNLAFVLRPTARPNIDVLQRKSSTGKKYLIVRPDNGLCYPSVDFFCNKTGEIVDESDRDNVGLVVNCERFTAIDYTAAKGIERLSREMRRKQKRLLLLHVDTDIVKSLALLCEDKCLRIVNEEDVDCAINDATTTGVDEGNDGMMMIPTKQTVQMKSATVSDTEDIEKKENEQESAKLFAVT